MEDLILKIIDIEDRAQEIIKDAKQADKSLDKNIEDETKKLRRGIRNRAVEKCEALKEAELKDADERCEAIKNRTQQQIDGLNKKYQDNKNIWIDKIVNNIIGS